MLRVQQRPYLGRVHEQPTNVNINWGHPSARGLTVCLVGSKPWTEHKSRAPATVITSIGVRRNQPNKLVGFGVDVANGIVRYGMPATQWNLTGRFSAVAGFVMDNVTLGANATLLHSSYLSTSYKMPWRIQYTSTYARFQRIGDSVAQGVKWDTSLSLGGDGVLVRYSVSTFNTSGMNTTPEVWVNGVQDTALVKTGADAASATVDGTNLASALNLVGTPTDELAGGLFWMYVFGRQIAPEEHRLFYDRPFCILRGPRT